MDTIKKVTTGVLKEWRKEKRPITMLTAYDYGMARLLDEAGIDMLLVGDSLGNVVLGYDSTLPVTMEDMIHHGKAVCRGVKRAFVVVDMPFMSYQVCVEDAVKNAGRIMKETGAQGVKVEGGQAILPAVKKIIAAGIPVVAHLGLTPQSVNQLGGFKVQGKDEETAQQLINDAKALSDAGVIAITLECVPKDLAQKITEQVTAPTIGIGAGNGCLGQVLVVNDMLGMQSDFVPKFVEKYADLKAVIIDAAKQYKDAVIKREFPAKQHSFKISAEVLDKLY